MTPRTKPDYLVRPARYAKGKMAVQCPSPDVYKTRAARLAEALARGRYTGREGAYIMSPGRAAKFERLYALGWDATYISYELIPPDAERLLAEAVAEIEELHRRAANGDWRTYSDAAGVSLIHRARAHLKRCGV